MAASAVPESTASIRMVQAFALLTFLSLTVFGTYRIATDTAIAGALGLAGASAVLLTLIGLKLTKNIGIAQSCLIAIILVFCVVLLTTGGIQGTGLFWLFSFPIAAFLLAGQRQGLYWVSIFFAVIVLLWAFGRYGSVPLYYNDVQIRQALVVLTFLAAGMFVSQGLREKYEREAVVSQRAERQALTDMEELHIKVDRTKSEFVTLASHQLRTPISAISWSSEMLLNGDAGSLRAAQYEYVQGIYDSTRRLSAIVDALLLVSGLEAGELHVRPEPTDVAALSGKLLREQVKKYPDKMLTIQEFYDHNLPKVRLDQSIVKRILQNVFSNAVKYSPEGAMISVSITRSDQPLGPGGRGRVIIDVADTGYGIPKDEQENVFAKLFRARNVRKKDTDGTGLGLFIVKALLDRTGGRVSFVSEENKGTTFTIQLPLEGMEPRQG